MKKSVKAIIIIAIICICACTAVLITKHFETKKPSGTDVAGGLSQTEESGGAVYKYTNSGYKFSRLSSYTGEYVEDGKNENVKNIAAITIKNTTETDCRYAEVSVVTEGETYEFAFTTLKSGESVTVLEKNKKSYNEKSKIKTISIDKISGFQEKPQMYKDIFELTVMDGVINIKNISDKDIDGTVYVYYKNTRDGRLFGGITYRIPFDSIKAGELKQMPSKHLSKENSVLEFITYEH